MKPTAFTPREEEILANVQSYSVVCGMERLELSDRQEAYQQAVRLSNERSRGAMVYAIGPVCGTVASALLATAARGKLKGLLA